MDMTPPQAPPAITQTNQQEAVAAVARLVAAQQWLSTQETGLPLPTTAVPPRNSRAVLNDLIDFWQAPVVPAPGALPIARWDAFGRRMASVMRDEATLRYLDGTLSENARSVVNAFTRRDGEDTVGSVHAYALLVGQVAYAGAVVLTDDRQAGLALLFTQERGWEEFSCRADLHRATEDRMRRDLARHVVPAGVMADDLHAALDAPFVSTREWQHPAWLSLVNRVIALQQERVEAAWAGIDAAAGDQAASRYLADRIAPLLRLQPMLDVYALLQARDARLILHIEKERLAAAPDDVALAWRKASGDYAMTVRLAERQRLDAGSNDITPFEVFVHDALQTRLRAAGITEDPDGITVDTHDFSLSYFYNPTGRVDAAALGPPRKRVTLVQAAMDNVGALDETLLLARRQDGSLLAGLPPASLRQMIRRADVATGYRDYLAAALKTSPEGALTRALATGIKKARMRLDAEDARLGYFLADEPKGFADDHAFRGYQWVDAVLGSSAASGRRKVEGHDVVVRQLMYMGTPVRDVVVIGTRSSQAVSRVVLYTPDAPDGVAFREFDETAAAERLFLNQPSFESYLLDRLPVEFSRATANGSERHFIVPENVRRFRWVFNFDPADARNRSDVFSTRVIEGDFLDAGYDDALSLMSRNLSAVARTTAHADVDAFTPDVDAGTIGRGIADLIGRPFSASWRAYDRVREGNYAQAFVDATDAYVASLDFLAVGAMKPLLTRSIAVRTARPGHQLVAAAKRPHDPSSLFDARFVADGVSLREASAVTDGVYTIGTRRYIEQRGKVYRVRRDGQTWRLTHPDSATYAPHIRRAGNGTWEYAGISGGLTPRSFPWEMLPDSSAYDGLSFHQRMVFEQTLVARTSEHEARYIVRRVANDPINAFSTALTAEQQAHWRAALRSAHEAPVDRLHRLPHAARPGAAAAPRPAPWTPPAILEEIAPAQWPDTVWYYPSAREAFPTRTANNLILAQSRHNAAGVMGVGGLALGPRAPWASLNAALGGPTLIPGRWPLVFEWVSVNLAALRTRTTTAGGPAFRVFRIRNGSGVNYLIREAGAAGDQPNLWLRDGEFDTGVRFMTMTDVDGAVPGPSRAPPHL